MTPEYEERLRANMHEWPWDTLADSYIEALKELEEARGIIERAQKRVTDEEDRKKEATSYYSVVEQLSVAAEIAEQERDKALDELRRTAQCPHCGEVRECIGCERRY